jgi:hypothetical protein
MDFDPDSGRRSLRTIEGIATRMKELYQALPLLRAHCAPGWTGEAADHASKMLAQYDGAKREVLGKLNFAGERLRSAIRTAEALARLTEEGGP